MKTLGNYLPPLRNFFLIQAQLQEFAPHQERDHDHMALVVEDGVKLNVSVIRIGQIINNAAKIKTNRFTYL